MILCAWLLKYPTEVLEVLEAEADDILGWYVDGTGERDGRRWEEQTTVIQPFGLDSVAGPRGLTHSDMDTLVAVRGVVAKCGIVLPNMEVAHFACSACKYPSPQCVRGGHVLQPEHCGACHLSDLGIVHNMSTFQDMQHVELQEVAEDIPQGQTPCTLTLCLCTAELSDFPECTASESDGGDSEEEGTVAEGASAECEGKHSE